MSHVHFMSMDLCFSFDLLFDAHCNLMNCFALLCFNAGGFGSYPLLYYFLFRLPSMKKKPSCLACLLNLEKMDQFFMHL